MADSRREYMTPRQRVLASVEHRPVDRMPIDLGVHFSTGISAFAYQDLREHLGLDTSNIELIDCVQCLARVDDDIAERFHVDTVLLNPPFPQTKRWNVRGKYSFNVPAGYHPVMQPDGSYLISDGTYKMVMPAGGYFFDGAWPGFYGVSDDERLAMFASRAEQLRAEGDRFTLMMGFWAFMGGLDFACEMLTDPEEVMRRSEKHLEWQIGYFDKINALLGNNIDAIELNSDLGMQSGPICTPDSYERCVLPYLKRFCDHVHNTSNIKTFLHSCGSIWELMDMIIEGGIDILNPVQISAARMDSRSLKEKYGSKICFWGGGCDTQSVLWMKSPEEVSAHVKGQIDIFAPGGGFVFNQVHNIMGNVPAANIVAMLDTAYENAFTV